MKVVEILSYEENTKIEIQFILDKVKAGFASPAESYTEKIDFAEKYIKHPAATFFVKVSGESMIDAGIFDGDTLIVDRSLEYKKNSTVIASVDNDFAVKKIKVVDGKTYLKSENENYPDREITGEEELIIWGVVTYNIHQLYF